MTDKKRIQIDNFHRRLESYAYEFGADFFGIADMAPARDFIMDQCESKLVEYPLAVSMGMRISDGVVDGHDLNEKHNTSLYWWHVYEIITPMLDRLAQRVQRQLQMEGYRTFHVPGSMPYNYKARKGLLPHKLPAHLAGLGWIGKSCLLITREFGPRVRFVTVLTDAPLKADKPLDRKCGKCTSCIDVCPVKALKGIEFRPQDPVDVRFDTLACQNYRKEHPCGKCVELCPFGKPGKG